MKEGYVLYYKGKTIDTFELAISQMLECWGISAVRFIDCVGCRSFGYHFEGDVSEWFRPMIDLEKAVLRVARKFEIPLICVKTVVTDRQEEMRSGVVLGPLREGIAVQGIRDYYYKGDGVYLFVRKMEGSQYQIFDPRGFPGMLVSEDVLCRMTEEGKDCFMIFLTHGVDKIKEVEPAQILKAGLEFHKSIAEKENREALAAVSCLTGGHGEQISCEYGIQNFILHMDEIFRLVSECRMLPRKTEYSYMHMKQMLYDISRNGKIRELPIMLKEIWGLLENETEISFF